VIDTHHKRFQLNETPAIDTHHKQFLVLAACVRHIPQSVLNIGPTVFQYTDSRFIYRINIQMIFITNQYTESRFIHITNHIHRTITVLVLAPNHNKIHISSSIYNSTTQHLKFHIQLKSQVPN
jgi:tRNA nucleotidyltransferase (CCA-adding enzyme)